MEFRLEKVPGSERMRVVCVGPEPDTLLAAIEQSIAKWQFILSQDKMPFDGGYHTCGLCMLFWDGLCLGCPVAEVVGQDECNGTPYAAYSELVLVDAGVGAGTESIASLIAEAELTLLRIVKRHVEEDDGQG